MQNTVKYPTEIQLRGKNRIPFVIFKDKRIYQTE